MKWSDLRAEAMKLNYHTERWYSNLSIDEKGKLETLRKAQNELKNLSSDKKFELTPQYWKEDEIPKFPEPEDSSEIRQKLKFSMHNSLIKLLTVYTF